MREDLVRVSFNRRRAWVPRFRMLFRPDPVTVPAFANAGDALRTVGYPRYRKLNSASSSPGASASFLDTIFGGIGQHMPTRGH